MRKLYHLPPIPLVKIQVIRPTRLLSLPTIARWWQSRANRVVPARILKMMVRPWWSPAVSEHAGTWSGMLERLKSDNSSYKNDIHTTAIIHSTDIPSVQYSRIIRKQTWIISGFEGEGILDFISNSNEVVRHQTFYGTLFTHSNRQLTSHLSFSRPKSVMVRQETEIWLPLTVLHVELTLRHHTHRHTGLVHSNP